MYDLLHTFTPDTTPMICSVRENYPREVGFTESARRPSSLVVGCSLLSDNVMTMMMMMITLHIVRCNWFEESRRLNKRLTKGNEDWLSTSSHLSYLSSQSHSLGNCLLDDENITWFCSTDMWKLWRQICLLMHPVSTIQSHYSIQSVQFIFHTVFWRCLLRNVKDTIVYIFTFFWCCSGFFRVAQNNKTANVTSVCSSEDTAYILVDRKWK
jgi:hypothetical protein